MAVGRVIAVAVAVIFAVVVAVRIIPRHEARGLGLHFVVGHGVAVFLHNPEPAGIERIDGSVIDYAGLLEQRVFLKPLHGLFGVAAEYAVRLFKDESGIPEHLLKLAHFLAAVAPSEICQGGGGKQKHENQQDADASFHGCTSFRQVVEAAPRKCGCRMKNAFLSDVNADFEILLEENREICMPQAAKKTTPDAPPN